MRKFIHNRFDVAQRDKRSHPMSYTNIRHYKKSKPNKSTKKYKTGLRKK